METEKLKELLAQSYNEGILKGYEEGIDAMIEMLQTFRSSFYNLKNERKLP